MGMLWKVKWHNKVCSECWQKVLVPRNGSTASNSLREERSLQRSLWDAREVGVEEDGLVSVSFVHFFPTTYPNNIYKAMTANQGFAKVFSERETLKHFWLSFNQANPCLSLTIHIHRWVFTSCSQNTSLILELFTLSSPVLQWEKLSSPHFLSSTLARHHPHIQVYWESWRELAPLRPLTASPLTGKSVRCQP